MRLIWLGACRCSSSGASRFYFAFVSFFRYASIAFRISVLMVAPVITESFPSLAHWSSRRVGVLQKWLFARAARIGTQKNQHFELTLEKRKCSVSPSFLGHRPASLGLSPFRRSPLWPALKAYLDFFCSAERS